ncbi:MAG: prolipoprotein diacylglyceryl transferase [Rickettsiales bacterium]|jgi:phosphatidylglycerol:prolipoprotein diacylglycerol transferase|nr:prolipoprotein diacylglyceryl transferase [Rickettsiales bacterium]
MLQIILPFFDPNILSFGPIQIRWYSVAYILGIVAAHRIIRYLNDLCKLGLDNEDFYNDFILHIILGIIIGGRLGYIAFYSIRYFARHPLEIFALWHGGMSFHGGLLGVIIASILLCRKYSLDLFLFLDMLSIAAPIGLFLGRIANFINLELYGRPTGMPWGMVFPTADSLSRHPSQLYEAFFEGVVIFIVMLGILRRKKLKVRGLNSGIFLLLYGIFRIFIEIFREPDFKLPPLLSSVTLGQILSLPMIIAGIAILRRVFRKSKARQPG